jgi:subtilisin family serine protease
VINTKNKLAFDLMHLSSLMDISTGRSNLTIGLIDGYVDMSHPAFKNANIKYVNNYKGISNLNIYSNSCIHGTYIAGVLSGKRGLECPSISPSCQLIIRPIFFDEEPATMRELRDAVVETIEEGANIINLSIGLQNPTRFKFNEIDEIVKYALKKDVILVIAAGQTNFSGYLPFTNHSSILSVAGCDILGKPLNMSNFGISIGKNGIMAPAVSIISTLPGNNYGSINGTSVSSSLVSGIVALLWSIFPEFRGFEIIHAIRKSIIKRRSSVIPPLINAELALKNLYNRNI